MHLVQEYVQQRFQFSGIELRRELCAAFPEEPLVSGDSQKRSSEFWRLIIVVMTLFKMSLGEFTGLRHRGRNDWLFE